MRFVSGALVWKMWHFCQLQLNEVIRIEMCLLLAVFHLVAPAVVCVVSCRTVTQLFAFDLATCVFNWCRICLNLWFVLMWVCAVDRGRWPVRGCGLGVAVGGGGHRAGWRDDDGDSGEPCGTGFVAGFQLLSLHFWVCDWNFNVTSTARGHVRMNEEHHESIHFQNSCQIQNPTQLQTASSKHSSSNHK